MLSRIYRSCLLSLCLYIGLSLSHGSVSVDTKLIGYYNDFMSIADECKTNVNRSEIRLEMTNKLPKSIVAMCYYNLNIVQVNTSIWQRLSYSEKEQTIFHELGHCLLNQEHNNSSLNIMNSAGFIETDIYKYNYDYFIRKLFTNCQKDLASKFRYKG